MIIHLGSKHPLKIQAVKEVISSYDFLKNAEIIPIEINSIIIDQPKTLNETISGSIYRAKFVYNKNKCDYSIGIESGLMEVPYTKTGFMEFCSCSIYDGNIHHLGLSSAFEFPKKVIKLIIENGLNANQAAFQLGLKVNRKIGTWFFGSSSSDWCYNGYATVP